jgi:hypothetical protein
VSKSSAAHTPSSPVELPPGSETLLAESSERWRQREGARDATLLRLVILRDLVRALHAQKSRFLATGQKSQAQSLKDWEARIDELKGCSPLEGDLYELLSGTRRARKRTRLLPEALYSSIEREKLERYDRQWEAAIAAEGASLGWRFWSLSASVEIMSVEAWNRRLAEQIWPHGITLYVEGGNAPGAALAGAPGQVPSWPGRWIVLLHNKFRAPAELGLDIAAWPGTAADPAPQWKLLFSPKST